MNRAKVYGVGVGPGDPDLMTVKACSLIRENDVIAFRGSSPEESLAYRIAAAAVPEISSKQLIAVSIPMVRDRELLEQSRRETADEIEKVIDSGKNVIYITLGDPSVYCSFSYLQSVLENDGYETEIVPAVTSFSAAAARLGVPLAEWDQPLHIMPALHYTDEDPLRWPGNFVLMKPASAIREVKALLSDTGYAVQAVENCGLENERVYRSVEEIPDDAGYFSLIIAREKK